MMDSEPNAHMGSLAIPKEIPALVMERRGHKNGKPISLKASSFAILEMIEDMSPNPSRFEIMIIRLMSEYLCRKSRHSLKKLMGLFEQNIIMDVLDRSNGNQRDAGRILGLKSTTLNAKIKKYEIKVVRQARIHSAADESPVHRESRS